MDKPEFRGTTLDWGGFTKAQLERWEKVTRTVSHCKIHDTYFEYDAEDGKPCWNCLEEFTKEL